MERGTPSLWILISCSLVRATLLQRFGASCAILRLRAVDLGSVPVATHRAHCMTCDYVLDIDQRRALCDCIIHVYSLPPRLYVRVENAVVVRNIHECRRLVGVEVERTVSRRLCAGSTLLEPQGPHDIYDSFSLSLVSTGANRSK